MSLYVIVFQDAHGKMLAEGPARATRLDADRDAEEFDYPGLGYMGTLVWDDPTLANGLYDLREAPPYRFKETPK